MSSSSQNINLCADILSCPSLYPTELYRTETCNLSSNNLIDHTIETSSENDNVVGDLLLDTKESNNLVTITSSAEKINPNIGKVYIFKIIEECGDETFYRIVNRYNNDDQELASIITELLDDLQKDNHEFIEYQIFTESQFNKGGFEISSTEIKGTYEHLRLFLASKILGLD